MANLLNSNRREIRKKDQMINEHLHTNYKSEIERKKKIAELQSAFSEVQAVDKDWGWLDPNDFRFINWTWFVLKHDSPSLIDDIIDIDFRVKTTIINDDKYIDVLRKLNIKAFNLSSRKIADKYAMLIELFSKGEATIEEQLYIIQEICKRWEEIINDERMINFLSNKPSTKSEFAYKKIKELSEERWLFRETPRTCEEKHWSTITAFDLIDDKYKKELIIQKIKRAWSQKKYKEKDNAKKPYSISMTPDTKKKLDKIADFVDGKICDAISRIIDEEFERQKDKIKSN